MRTLRLLPLLALLSGCFAINEGDGSGGTGDLPVSAQIASVSLASDCPSAKSSGISITPPGGAPGFADCAGSAISCGICQQSTLQLTFDAAAAAPKQAGSAHLELVTVRVLDATTGQSVDELAGREPQRFDEGRFVTWDEVVAAGGQVRASYKLEAPDWAHIGGGQEWTTRSMKLQVEVVLRVDGVLRTLRSGPIMREPEVVT